MPTKSYGSVTVTWPDHTPHELEQQLRARIPELQQRLPLLRVVLFGSWATGRATAYSDIDVLVIYEDPERSDAFGIVREVIGIRGVEPHVYTRTQAEKLGETLDAMTRCGIVLFDRGEPAP